MAHQRRLVCLSVWTQKRALHMQRVHTTCVSLPARARGVHSKSTMSCWFSLMFVDLKRTRWCSVIFKHFVENWLNCVSVQRTFSEFNSIACIPRVPKKYAISWEQLLRKQKFSAARHPHRVYCFCHGSVCAENFRNAHGARLHVPRVRLGDNTKRKTGIFSATWTNLVKI